jgi:hypothetical protein
MNFKKCTMAAIGSLVVMFLLSYVWHRLLMAGLYMDESGALDVCHRPEPYIPSIAVGYAVLASIMAYLYPKGVEGDNKLMNGIRFGAIMGVLWILPLQLVFNGVLTGFSIKVIAIDTAWHVIEQGIGGVIIAYVYGMKD